MIITCRTKSAASDAQIAMEVSTVLARRAALTDPPVTLAVSDAVALGIAGLFVSPSDSGQVIDRFVRTRAADSAALIQAAQFEQGYASPEGHAALYCLVGWVRSREHRFVSADPA